MDWTEVQVLNIVYSTINPSTFTYTLPVVYTDGNHAEKGYLKPYASAQEVQNILQGLPSVRSVLVNKADQSSLNQYDAYSSNQYSIAYRITFIDAGHYPTQNLLTAVDNSAATVTRVRAGAKSNSNKVQMIQTTPSVPVNVLVSAVSKSELGVRWNAPTFTGGATITKFLIEWDTRPDFGHASGLSSISFSDVVDVATSKVVNAANEILYFTYKVQNLEAVPTYVRVSAFNVNGYGPPGQGWPVNASSCDTMPTHCSITPVDQLPYLPITPSVALSSQQVANRLEVSWLEPAIDRFGFITSNIPPTKYNVQWATDSNFTDAQSYGVTMVEQNNQAVSCKVNACSVTLGNEVQKITVASTNGYPLDGGAFIVLYIGKQAKNAYVLARKGSTSITFMDSSMSIVVGDYVSIDSAIYQLDAVSGQDATLSRAFIGDYTDVVNAYYINKPT
jgi:hypothetical protein